MTKEETQKKIAALPKGSIVTKKINGKGYEYWQYSENGKQVSKRVKGEELEILKEQIALRKELEASLSPLATEIDPHRKEIAR